MTETPGNPPAVGFLPHRQTRQVPYELIFAVIAIAIITAWYTHLAQDGVPSSSGLLGHGLGVVGFLMMLSTEFLYTLRKRLRSFAFGRMSTWLQWHVFTGIVGPYLVLLHSAGKFNGLAGVVTLFTVLMVVSGFIGRYLYTAAPRTVEGVELVAQELQEQIASADRQLQAQGSQLGEVVSLAEPELPPGWLAVLGRPWFRWRQRQRLRRALQQLRRVDRAQATQVQALLARRYRLRLQIQSLAAARRLLALWHVFHIPLGAMLFSLALLHIGGALYYATFLK